MTAAAWRIRQVHHAGVLGWGGLSDDLLAAQRHRQLAEAGVDTAFREGNLRLSVHLFNTPADVDQALAALHAPPHDY